MYMYMFYTCGVSEATGRRRERDGARTGSCESDVETFCPVRLYAITQLYIEICERMRVGAGRIRSRVPGRTRTSNVLCRMYSGEKAKDN